MDYENDEQQQHQQPNSSGSVSSHSSNGNTENSSSNNSSSSNLLVNLPLLHTSSTDEADGVVVDDEEHLPLHPSSPNVPQQHAPPENQDNQGQEQDEQENLPVDNSLFMSSLQTEQQQQEQEHINDSMPLNLLSTSSSSSSTASSSTNSNNYHPYYHHHHQHHHEHYHLNSEHSQQPQQTINHHQHSPPPSPPQLTSTTFSSSAINVAGAVQPLATTTTAESNINAVSTTTTTTTGVTHDNTSGESAGEVPNSLSASVGSAQLVSEPQQQPEREEEIIRASSSSTTTPPPSPAPALLHLSLATTTTTPATTLPHTSLPYTPQQYQQRSSSSSTSASSAQHHHYHTAAGCSNLLGGYYTNNGRAMFANNETSNTTDVAAAGTTITTPGAVTVGQVAAGTSSIGSGNVQGCSNQPVDRLKLLYPNVDESLTPLPRSWSAHDKCLAIGLSQNNMRVYYKGKQHNDAASVRTAHPIPAACGLYYYEVKIVSKGKNGYMGIGLTAQQFRMNRLPGWDKQSYGYHGDDGHSFSSSGNGQAYGPTFTTGDIIGCCVNFVNNTCFYTKNGIDLGIAFRDLPNKLYPTVGLQTPGEELDANFGQEPFKFDQIDDMMKQMRAEMQATIYDFPMPAELGDTTSLLHKLVASYLVHNGYTETIEAFVRTTEQTFREEMPSIRSRQKILKLVMTGQMGEAIEYTTRFYPGLLENNKKLWFMLKCRQFIEMINGSDEYCPNSKITAETQTTPPNQTSVIQSTKSYQNGNGAVITTDNKPLPELTIADGASENGNKESGDTSNTEFMNDVEMDNSHGHETNGKTEVDVMEKNDTNYTNYEGMDEEMEVDMAAHRHTQGIERILDFGKELFQMSMQLEKESRMSEEERQMLENAFSLIAYSNPWSSPLGWQLCPSKREPVCTALNSAILESLNYPSRPPLNIAVAHAAELLKLMAHTSIGHCAFVEIEDVFPKN